MFIHTFNHAMQERFGKKMYRLSLDCGFTCPNRDGTKSKDGCIFCSGAGAGNFAGKGDSVDAMLENAKLKIRNKTGTGCGYIAYLQSFTNTYAPIGLLRTLYTEIVNRPDIEALAVATRPDCLPPEVVRLLAELNRIKPVWVELGLQTANDKTAERINRCYPLPVYDDAVNRLHACGIEVVTHVIIGLPGEERSDIVNTIAHITGMHTDGIKLHLLHVLKGTRLAELYENGEYTPLSMEEYIDILCTILPFIPKNTVIHRYTGDGDKKELLAPLWSADKKKTLNAIHKAFLDRDIIQGSACRD